MTPEARLQAAIEIGADIDGAPADRVMAAAFRRRRYAGSKDRRAITERLYGVLRRRARLDWWIGRVMEGPVTWRLRVIADLGLSDGLDEGAVAQLFNGVGHGPAPLEGPEQALIGNLAGSALNHPEMPCSAALEIPEWMEAPLRRQWGDKLTTEMAALNQPADLDLRVNTLKGGRAAAIEALAADGIEARPTPLSPLGLRVRGRVRLDAAGAFRDGLVEVQDEGSQLVALLTGARPGMTVFDVCAGAGGKTLALAAGMENQGTLIAADRTMERLKRMKPRLRRAGITGVEAQVLEEILKEVPEEGPDPSPWPEADLGTADRVLIDAPCSGSGAWRRDPGGRWRLTAAELERDLALQQRILAQAAPLVSAGGRLVYATCSVLPAENQDQVEGFLAGHPEFKVIPAARAWAETIARTLPDPAPCPSSGPYLALSPAATGTDGFFAAVLEKTQAG